jgi:hypothetical protein
MSRQGTIDKYYDAIMESNCADEFKAMINRMHIFLKNKKKYGLSGISLPNYLWAAKRGCGISTLAKLFAEYLYASKAIEFCGTAKLFEFKLDYIEPQSHFTELSRLNNSIIGFAGHNRYFKGVGCLDINEWIDHADEDHFKTMLDYVSDNKDHLLVVFCIHTDNKTTINTIETAILSHMRLETLTPQFPDVDELIAYIETRFINSDGFFFTEDAKELLHESIVEITGSECFNGFKTISQLSEKIMFNILTTELNNKKQITAEMLSDIAKDSSFISKLKMQYSTKRMIGFSGKDNNYEQRKS